MGIENVKKYLQEEKRGPEYPYPEWVIKAFEEFARPDEPQQIKCRKCGTCLGLEATVHICHWCDERKGEQPHIPEQGHWKGLWLRQGRVVADRRKQQPTFKVGDKVQHKPHARDFSKGIVMGHDEQTGWPLVDWNGLKGEGRLCGATPHDPSELEVIPPSVLEPTFRPGDFVSVIDPTSARGGEYGEVIGLFGQCYCVKFGRYAPSTLDYHDSGVSKGHGRIMRLDQLRKEP